MQNYRCPLIQIKNLLWIEDVPSSSKESCHETWTMIQFNLHHDSMVIFNNNLRLLNWSFYFSNTCSCFLPLCIMNQIMITILLPSLSKFTVSYIKITSVFIYLKKKHYNYTPWLLWKIYDFLFISVAVLGGKETAMIALSVGIVIIVALLIFVVWRVKRR